MLVESENDLFVISLLALYIHMNMSIYHSSYSLKLQVHTYMQSTITFENEWNVMWDVHCEIK
jgi:hypothetical protein